MNPSPGRFAQRADDCLLLTREGRSSVERTLPERTHMVGTVRTPRSPRREQDYVPSLTLSFSWVACQRLTMAEQLPKAIFDLQNLVIEVLRQPTEDAWALFARLPLIWCRWRSILPDPRCNCSIMTRCSQPMEARRRWCNVLLTSTIDLPCRPVRG